MKKIVDILGQLLSIAKDAKVWFRVLVFVIVGTACIVTGAIVFSKTKVKKEDCAQCNEDKKYLTEQNRALLNGLLKIGNDIKSTSFVDQGDYIIFASFDSVPKKKLPANVMKAIHDYDSIILKLKNDSLNRKIKQTKN